MEEMRQYGKNYQEYKKELDAELSRTAEGFVRIGYLLKVARDTEVLSQSPYQSVTEFAKAEYGIDKTMVSRFISINDRFSEGGYSDQLLEQYRGYGYAKLTLMLSLPDEINAQLSPAYSKAEIQAVKDEMDAEKEITDLEVMMEIPAQSRGTGGCGEQNLLDMLVRQLGEDSPDLYVRMAPLMALPGDTGNEWTLAAREAMAPNGEKQYFIRISGIGRFMVSVRDTEDAVTATSLRTMEKHTYDYQNLLTAWKKILPPCNGCPDTEWTKDQIMTAWELEYAREYPGKEEAAPVRQKKAGKPEPAPASRRESRVQKAPSPKPRSKEEARPRSREEVLPREPEKPESAGMEPVSAPVEAEGESRKMEQEPGGENEPAAAPDRQPEEQLPGQIGMQEAMEEADRRAAEKDPPEEAPMAAGQEPGGIVWEQAWTAWDQEWEFETEGLGNSLKTMPDIPLSRQESSSLKEIRERAIHVAALVERELLMRGEEF